MTMVPASRDTEPARFRVVKRGYTSEAVDKWITHAQGSAAARVAENDELRREVQRLQQALLEADQNERVGRLINQARMDAERIRTEAQQQADASLQEAQARVGEVEAEAEELREQIRSDALAQVRDLEDQRDHLQAEIEKLESLKESLRGDVDEHYAESLARLIHQVHRAAQNIDPWEVDEGDLQQQAAAILSNGGGADVDGAPTAIGAVFDPPPWETDDDGDDLPLATPVVPPPPPPGYAERAHQVVPFPVPPPPPPPPGFVVADDAPTAPVAVPTGIRGEESDLGLPEPPPWE